MHSYLNNALLEKGKSNMTGATWPYDSKPDAEDLKKKSKVVIFEWEGCGVVSHIHASNYIVSGDQYGKVWFNKLVSEVIIRVYYDHSAEPSIEMPYMDFLGDIDYSSNFYNTIYFSKVKYSHNFRINMPFRKHIKIELENPTDFNMTGYSEIQWETYDSLPDNCGYLYVDYRNAKKRLPIDLVEVCDIDTQGSIIAHWYQISSDNPKCTNGELLCEGNHEFFLDGDDYPTMQSQGAEDFYNYSWAFQELQSDNYAAILRRDNHESGGSTIAVIKCRDKDAIRFEKSCRGVIDYTQEYFSSLTRNPRHQNSERHMEFDVDYKSCYYYYAIK